MQGSFFDSNIVLYSFGPDDTKAVAARSLLADCGVISVQVLNEVVNVGRRKLLLDWDEIREIVEPLRSFLTIVDLTIPMHVKGLQLAQRYQFAIYDSMIVAAALAANCDTLWSEDMHDGLVVDDKLTIRNPFG